MDSLACRSQRTCICPFCRENCYTEEQMIQHIKAKNAWARKLGRPLTHIITEPMTFDYEGELNAKINALTEYLGIEFVFERISDGTGKDEVNVFARKKGKKK